MSDPGTPQAKGANRRWVGPVLLVSLLVNFFLVAHLAVGFFHHFRGGERGGPMMLGMPHSVVMRELSGEERRSLRRAMRPHMEAIRPQFRDIRAAREGLSTAVAADPYDPVAVKQAFAGLRTAMDAVALTSQDALIEAFADLSPETRDRIAEALKRRPPGRRDHPPSGRPADEDIGERD